MNLRSSRLDSRLGSVASLDSHRLATRLRRLQKFRTGASLSRAATMSPMKLSMHSSGSSDGAVTSDELAKCRQRALMSTFFRSRWRKLTTGAVGRFSRSLPMTARWSLNVTDRVTTECRAESSSSDSQLWLSLCESQKVVSASRLRERHQTHQEGSELTSGRVVESLQFRRRHQQSVHVSRLRTTLLLRRRSHEPARLAKLHRIPPVPRQLD